MSAPGEMRDLFSAISPRPSPGNVVDLALHPRWLRRLTFGPRINFVNLAEPGAEERRGDAGQTGSSELAGHAGPRVVDVLGPWPGKEVVKGITNAVDAVRAVEVGCDGVLVSNHGGRQIVCHTGPPAD